MFCQEANFGYTCKIFLSFRSKSQIVCTFWDPQKKSNNKKDQFQFVLNSNQAWKDEIVLRGIFFFTTLISASNNLTMRLLQNAKRPINDYEFMTKSQQGPCTNWQLNQTGWLL